MLLNMLVPICLNLELLKLNVTLPVPTFLDSRAGEIRGAGPRCNTDAVGEIHHEDPWNNTRGEPCRRTAYLHGSRVTTGV